MHDTAKSRAFIWMLAIGFCLLWLYGLDARVLVPTDEGRYAEMAREMFSTGDWITTRLNGIKYFEKPPLQIWMTALTFKLFGLGEWQARLWTGLCGLIGVAAVAYTGRKVFGQRVGFDAALVLGSCVLWAMLGHINTLDMGLSAMMTLALCGLLVAQRDAASATERRNGMLVCWAGMALAVMSKGLIGAVLPGAVLVVYTFVARDWSIWKRLHMGLGLLVFFAITTPWFVLVSLQNPEFPQFFFIHEHFQRFTSKIHHRAGPIYYFVPLLLLGMVPWLGVLAQGLWQGVRNRGTGFQAEKMLLVWAGFIFFFFSISSSKLPSYILPIFPALALLVACYLRQVSQRVLVGNAALLVVLGIIGLALLNRMPLLAKNEVDLPLYLAYMPWAAAGAAIAVCGGVLAILARRHTARSLVLIAVTGFLAGQCLMFGHDGLGRYAAGYNMVAAVKAELTPQTRLFAVNRYEQSLPFYLERTTTLVGHADEMDFGLSQQPELWIPDVEVFVKQWKEGYAGTVRDIAIMRPDTYADLKQRGVPMRVIGSDPRRVIVSNQPHP
ncbi:glycosyltransferase family 39 protein [Actimicrobium antarcticum]|uniref:glycosyltransferase family 39 protein n=1 Tax=Actimicrobium antarcticum TaxID=1051899 RepID=UPI0031D032C6